MMDEERVLDGNAAGGLLGMIFATDVTASWLECGGCGHEGPFGELRLYRGGPGQILRCGSCGIVNVRAVEAGERLVVDFRGSSRLEFVLPEATE